MGARRTRRRAERVRLLWAVAALLAVALVVGLTLREDELVGWQNLTGRNVVPLRHHLAALRCVLADDCVHAAAAARYLLVDVVGNLLLFVPVGLTVAAAHPGRTRRRRFLVATAVALVLSAGIETAQLWMPSRASDVDDVLFNTTGAMLGAALGILVPRPRPRGRRRATPSR